MTISYQSGCSNHIFVLYKMFIWTWILKTKTLNVNRILQIYEYITLKSVFVNCDQSCTPKNYALHFILIVAAHLLNVICGLEYNTC